MPATGSSPIKFSQPVAELIRRRFSCRSYASEPIGKPERAQLDAALAAAVRGPLGSPLRFRLITATAEDNQSLRGLGTYGFIRGATGFIIGAAPRAEKNLEDFGCRLEQIILLATDLGLGTCWLGGTFTQSSFAAKISRTKGESLPAVVAIGRIADPEKSRRDRIRILAGSDRRRPWEDLFFQDSFASPLTRDAAGPYAEPLEMVRLGPSASNKQPWRILRAGGDWHFYLQRTKGYREGFFQRVLQVADIQRIDMGIAMCHFELAARALGLRGEWLKREPAIEKPDDLTEYCITWSM
jgi:nitroreductase